MNKMLCRVDWLHEVATDWASGTKFKAIKIHDSIHLSDDDGSDGPLSNLTQMRIWCDHNRIEWAGSGQFRNGMWWHEDPDSFSEEGLKSLAQRVLGQWLDITGSWQGELLAAGFVFVTFADQEWSNEAGGFVRK